MTPKERARTHKQGTCGPRAEGKRSSRGRDSVCGALYLRAAFMPVGAGLEIAADGQQRLLRKRHANKLQGDREVIGETARQHERGKSGQIACLDDALES